MAALPQPRHQLPVLRRLRAGRRTGGHDMTTADVSHLTYSSARGRWVLVITVLGSGIASLDATVVNIALPTIGREFHTGIAALQWVITGYTLTLAAFLLIGGSLGDHFGRKKIFLIGIVWFALASAACGFAPNALFLILTRLIQGVGAALLTPGSLAILQAAFRPADRGRAIGAWSGIGGGGRAGGPVPGGHRRGGQRGRPVPRRLAGAGRVLAADLRDQPADRGGGRAGEHPARAGVP